MFGHLELGFSVSMFPDVVIPRSQTPVSLNFINFDELGDNQKGTIEDIMNMIDQFCSITGNTGFGALDPIDTVQDLISEDLIPHIARFRDILERLGATEGDLSYISPPSRAVLENAARKKGLLFTLSELIKNYPVSGTDKKIAQARDAIKAKIANEGISFLVNPNTGELVHKGDYEQSEAKYAEFLEKDIFPILFSYEICALMSLGMISAFLDVDTGRVMIQPKVFHYKLFSSMMNNRGINPIFSTARDIGYVEDTHLGRHISRFLCIIKFGYSSIYKLVGNKDSKVAFIQNNLNFIYDITDGVYSSSYPIPPRMYNMGILRMFYEEYKGIISDKAVSKRIIGSKYTLVDRLGKLFEMKVTPSLIMKAGQDLGIQSFLRNPNYDAMYWNSFAGSWEFLTDNPKVHLEAVEWQLEEFAYRSLQDEVYYPTSLYDPMSDVNRVVFGGRASSSFSIVSGYVEHPFWSVNEYGRIVIDSTTKQLLGNPSNYKYALSFSYYATYERGKSQPLNLRRDILEENKEKYEHLFDKVGKAFTDYYPKGRKSTINVQFLTVSHNGFMSRNTVNSPSSGIPSDLRKELGGGYRLNFDLELDSNGNAQRKEDFDDFVWSVVFYMVLLNSFAFVIDNTIETNGGLAMVISPQMLLDDRFLFATSSQQIHHYITYLSPMGRKIFQDNYADWNKDKAEKEVFSRRDLPPIYYLLDPMARQRGYPSFSLDDLRDWFNTRLGAIILDLI